MYIGYVWREFKYILCTFGETLNIYLYPFTLERAQTYILSDRRSRAETYIKYVWSSYPFIESIFIERIIAKKGRGPGNMPDALISHK